MPRICENNVEECFTYQAPTVEQLDRYGMIHEMMLECARAVLDACPSSRERSLALTKLQEARMWSNAAIALEDVPDYGG